MNREILFRGKRVDNGEWIYGDLLTPTDIMDVWEISENTGMGDRYEIDPETVGQFTGLTDKNGTKIFEGDIVKATYGCEQMDIREFTANHVVEYKPTGYGSAIGFFNNLPSRGALEVIGNIYDNPELLEEKE